MSVRILFITSTRVGDAVLSTGALAWLLKAHPGARVTVVCGPAAAPLFEAVPGLERIIVLEKRWKSLHWLEFWWQCLPTWWDVLVDLRNAPITYLLGARRRFRLGRQPDGHRVEQIARALRISGTPPAPRLWTTEAHRAHARQLIPDGGPVLALGPTANWRGKTWPADRFIDLSARLTGPDGPLPGARIALFGQRHEREPVEDLISAIPADRRIDLIGGPSLLEVYACLERCRCFIGNDSGLMHMAAAAGIPTLGLFGPTSEVHYAPWGAKGASVRGVSIRDSYPLNLDTFDYRNTETLMAGLSVEQVFDAARKLLS